MPVTPRTTSLWSSTRLPQLKGADGEEWCFRLAAEQDNLRAALGWARDRDQPTTLIGLVQGLEFYWYTTGLLRELYEWNRAAIEHATDMPTEVRAGLLAFAGHGANGIGLLEANRELCRASVQCSRDAGQPPMPMALEFLGIVAMETNHPEEAIAYCDEALVVAREHGDLWDELHALQFLALNCSLCGEPERGQNLADEAVAGARRLGNGYLVAQALFDAGLARARPNRSSRSACWRKPRSRAGSATRTGSAKRPSSAASHTSASDRCRRRHGHCAPRSRSCKRPGATSSPAR